MARTLFGFVVVAALVLAVFMLVLAAAQAPAPAPTSDGELYRSSMQDGVDSIKRQLPFPF